MHAHRVEYILVTKNPLENIFHVLSFFKIQAKSLTLFIVRDFFVSKQGLDLPFLLLQSGDTSDIKIIPRGFPHLTLFIIYSFFYEALSQWAIPCCQCGADCIPLLKLAKRKMDDCHADARLSILCDSSRVIKFQSVSASTTFQ